MSCAFSRFSNCVPGTAIVGALILLASCVDRGPLRLEQHAASAFNPLRWDAGPAPQEVEVAPSELIFGITPFYSPERQQRMMDRVGKYLTKEIHIPVRAKIFSDYVSCVEAFGRGELHFAQLSPYAYILAEQRKISMTPFATAVAQGTRTYASYLVVRRSSKIRSLDEARGARLGFTDRWSTSGHLYPRDYLQRRGFDVDRDFQVDYFGQHDRVLRSLLDGDVDIAAVSSDTLVSAGVMGISGPVRVLAKAGRIPYDAMVAHPSLPAVTLHRLRKSFLQLSVLTEEGQRVLEDYNLINGFTPIPPGHFDQVRRIAASYRE